MGFFDDIGDFFGFGGNKDFGKSRRQEFEQGAKSQRGQLLQSLVRSGLGSSTVLQGQQGALERQIGRGRTRMEADIAEAEGPSFGQMLMSALTSSIGGSLFGGGGGGGGLVGEGFGSLFSSLFGGGSSKSRRRKGKTPSLMPSRSGRKPPGSRGYTPIQWNR